MDVNDKLRSLDGLVRAVALIDGLALLNAVTHDVRVDFAAAATAQQRTDGAAVVAGFDWSDAAQTSRALTARRAAAVAALTDPAFMLILFRALKQVTATFLTNLVQRSVRPITSITRASTTATATTPFAHGLGANGAQVQIAISGAAQAAYNGIQTVTIASATTFTYAVAGSPTTPATGTILYVLEAVALATQITDQQITSAIQAAVNAGSAD